MSLRTKEGLFLRWLEQNGADVSKVQWPSFTGGERGVTVSEALRREEVIFAVPRKLMLCVKGSLENPSLGPFLRGVRGKQCANEAWKVLVIRVCFERCLGEESEWKEYLQVVPQVNQFEHFVDNWPQKMLALLGEKSLGQVVEGKKADMRMSYKNLVENLMAWEKCDGKMAKFRETVDFEMFRWAWLCVESRAFLDRGDETGTMPPVLIPFADMLNHSADHADSAEFNRECFSLVADREIAPGGAVFNSYGRRTNRDLLLNYGFVLPQNPWDSVFVRFPWENSNGSSMALDLEKEKQALFQVYRSEEDVCRFYAGSVPATTFLWLCRVKHCSSMQELRVLRQSTSSVLSIENETAAVQSYREAVSEVRGMILVEKVLAESDLEQTMLDMLSVFSTVKANIVQSHLQFCEWRLRSIAEGNQR